MPHLVTGAYALRSYLPGRQFTLLASGTACGLGLYADDHIGCIPERTPGCCSARGGDLRRARSVAKLIFMQWWIT